jgi:hypothetical protein
MSRAIAYEINNNIWKRLMQDMSDMQASRSAPPTLRGAATLKRAKQEDIFNY